MGDRGGGAAPPGSRGTRTTPLGQGGTRGPESGGDGNRTHEPLACHASALPTELRPQEVHTTLAELTGAPARRRRPLTPPVASHVPAPAGPSTQEATRYPQIRSAGSCRPGAASIRPPMAGNGARLRARRGQGAWRLLALAVLAAGALGLASAGGVGTGTRVGYTTMPGHGPGTAALPSLSAWSAAPGGTALLRAGGFAPRSEVVVRLVGAGTTVQVAVGTGPSGRLAASVHVPRGALPGWAEVSLHGHGPGGLPVVEEVALRVARSATWARSRRPNAAPARGAFSGEAAATGRHG